jgi:CBS domain-containing protein
VNSTLAEAIERFDGGRPSYPVVDESGQLQGYCGRAELFEALRELPRLETRIRDFMRQDPPVIAADQSIIEAAVIMLGEEIEMLAVVSSDGGGRVIGVVSPLAVIQKAFGLLPRDSSLAIAQGNIRKQTH